MTLRTYGHCPVSGGTQRSQSRASRCRDRWLCFFFQAEDGIRDYKVTGVQTCALPITYVGPLSATIPVQTIRSLGLGSSSIVDTVRLIGSVDFVNASGTGNVTFQVYFDSAKSRVYTGTAAGNVSGAVTPNATTTSPFDVDIIDPAMRQLFLASTVYVGIRASVTGAVQGTAKLRALRARIVIKDKIF